MRTHNRAPGGEGWIPLLLQWTCHGEIWLKDVWVPLRPKAGSFLISVALFLYDLFTLDSLMDFWLCAALKCLLRRVEEYLKYY